MITLPREERQEVVASLRDSGLSLRAIEAATGISKKTVISDLRQVVESTPPEPEPSGLDEFAVDHSTVGGRGQHGHCPANLTPLNSLPIGESVTPPRGAGGDGGLPDA